MDFETLNSFVILSEKLNYTEASDILGITQPALSKRIRLLEEELKCQLFIRSPREVRLSTEGQKLVSFAKYMLAQEERLKNELKDTSSVIVPLRVGFFGFSVHTWFPEFINSFKKQYPGFDIELFTGNPKFLSNLLMDGRLNLLIASEFIKDRLRNYNHVVLKRDLVYIIIREDNPLSEYESLSISDLKDETFLMLSDHNAFANAFHSNRNSLLSEACLYEGISPKVKTVDSMVDLPMMVSCGEGVAMATKGVNFCSYNNVKFIPYKAPDGKQKYYDLLLYYDDYCRDAAELFEQAFEAFKERTHDFTV